MQNVIFMHRIFRNILLTNPAISTHCRIRMSFPIIKCFCVDPVPLNIFNSKEKWNHPHLVLLSGFRYAAFLYAATGCILDCIYFKPCGRSLWCGKFLLLVSHFSKSISNLPNKPLLRPLPLLSHNMAWMKSCQKGKAIIYQIK